ncbi:LysR substrate-binding domain-containing protein [Delftia acidovorans]|uniref:LysR substrate-binding domain-containing protein n=1 Tax=Delftia acidovorans TaxID=80866 RepID=UPI003B27D99C
MVREDLAAGRLVAVLGDCAAPPGRFCLYYSRRRHLPAALRALVDFLRLDGAGCTTIAHDSRQAPGGNRTGAACHGPAHSPERGTAAGAAHAAPAERQRGGVSARGLPRRDLHQQRHQPCA